MSLKFSAGAVNVKLRSLQSSSSNDRFKSEKNKSKSTSFRAPSCLLHKIITLKWKYRIIFYIFKNISKKIRIWDCSPLVLSSSCDSKLHFFYRFDVFIHKTTKSNKTAFTPSLSSSDAALCINPALFPFHLPAQQQAHVLCCTSFVSLRKSIVSAERH